MFNRRNNRNTLLYSESIGYNFVESANKQGEITVITEILCYTADRKDINLLNQPLNRVKSSP